MHTVGPIEEKPELLQSCYKTTLDLAKENQLKTIVCVFTLIINGKGNI